MEVVAVEKAPSSRSASRSLAHNSVFNLVGQGIPLVAAFFAIPRLIRGLGTDRFGVLTLAWMVIGYFSLFDLGLGRALTQIVAARLGECSDRRRAPSVVWPAMLIMGMLGVAGMLVVGLIAPWLVHSLLKIPAELQSETLRSFYLLAIGIPLVVITTAYMGILSAFQEFVILNVVRAPMGVITFVAPLAVLPFSRSLVTVTSALVIGRALACAALAVVCHRFMPPLSAARETGRAEIRELFTFGAWMSVTNVVGPLMMYLDRFVIGATLSVAAVAYYATPYEMVTKLLIVPNAVLGAIFPAFAASYRRDRRRLMQLFMRGTKAIALLLFPIVLLIVAFASEGLTLWLGADFARHSAVVLQWLAIGVFINSVAQLFATLVQGVGRPDLTAKIHMIELPLYLAVLWWAIHHYGILGAAIVWTGRVAFDGVLLFLISSRFLGKSVPLRARLGSGLLLALGVLVTLHFIPGMPSKIIVVAVIAIVYPPTIWHVVLADEERATVRSRIASS